MIAKLIVHGSDRAVAMDKMLKALSELRIEGVPSTVDIHRRILLHPQFRSGRYDTILSRGRHGADVGNGGPTMKVLLEPIGGHVRLNPKEIETAASALQDVEQRLIENGKLYARGGAQNASTEKASSRPGNGLNC